MLHKRSSKISVLAVSASILTSSGLLAVFGNEEHLAQSAARAQFSTRDILKFIKGDYAGNGRNTDLIRAATHYLTTHIDESWNNPDVSNETLFKSLLGFAELLQNHPHHSLPNMDSAQSARHVQNLLNTIIASRSLPNDHRYKDYARVYFGQLAIHRIKQNMSAAEKEAAWQNLSQVTPKHTRVGNLYRAHLILRNGYIPQDIEIRDGMPLIGLYAQKLLDDTYSESHPKAKTDQLKKLMDDARTKSHGELNAQPAQTSEPQLAPKPTNLNDQTQKQLRIELLREAIQLIKNINPPQNIALERPLLTAHLSPSPLSLQENSPSIEKRKHDQLRSADSDINATLDNPAKRQKKARREKIQFTQAQEDKFIELYNQYSGATLYKKVREEVLTQDQADRIRDSADLKSLINHKRDSIQKQRPNALVRKTKNLKSTSDRSPALNTAQRKKIFFDSTQEGKFVELYNQYRGDALYAKIREEILTPEEAASITDRDQFCRFVQDKRAAIQYKRPGVFVRKTTKLEPLTNEQLERIVRSFQGKTIRVDDRFKQKFWGVLTPSQRQQMGDINSQALIAAIRSYKSKLTEMGVTFHQRTDQ